MPRTLGLDALAREIRPGERVFLPGSAGEPVGLVEALLADPERTRGLEVTTTAVPGINPLDMQRWHETARISGMFMQPGFRDAQRAGRFRHLPLPYSGMIRHLQGERFDTCIVHLAPPREGRCSLGPAVELTPLAAGRSRRLIGVVNAQMPSIPGAESIAYGDLDLVAETDEPIRTYDTGAPSNEAQTIAAIISGLIEDGAVIQVGLGKVPDALFALLHNRRALRLHSGMLSDGIIELSAAGALDPAHRPTTCVFVGMPRLFDWLRDRPDVEVRGCEVTHDPRVLLGIDRFVAVNSALTVDLFGQCNLEIAGGSAVSGAGGAPDFARAARHSRGGLSIVALPASYGKDGKSRIVPALGDCLASLPRADVDVVVTEHGAAHLRGRSVHERAEALIAVAVPARRAELTSAWGGIARRL